VRLVLILRNCLRRSQLSFLNLLSIKVLVSLLARSSTKLFMAMLCTTSTLTYLMVGSLVGNQNVLMRSATEQPLTSVASSFLCQASLLSMLCTTSTLTYLMVGPLFGNQNVLMRLETEQPLTSVASSFLCQASLLFPRLATILLLFLSQIKTWTLASGFSFNIEH
jgi:hypothetical protein